MRTYRDNQRQGRCTLKCKASGHRIERERWVCGLVRVRVKDDPFVSDTRVEELYRETDAKPLEQLLVCRRTPSDRAGRDGFAARRRAQPPCQRHGHRMVAEVTALVL
jgi:hypothetical protein